MNIARQNLLRLNCEKATSKRKHKEKNISDKLLSQSISIDDEKKILRQNNIIEHEQLMSTARNVDINSKSLFFEKFVVIKDSLIF